MNRNPQRDRINFSLAHRKGPQRRSVRFGPKRSKNFHFVTPQADVCGATRDVRFGSKADMCSARAHVRYGPIADIGKLFDHLVGECDHIGRNC
jgi:hypothetical protein